MSTPVAETNTIRPSYATYCLLTVTMGHCCSLKRDRRLIQLYDNMYLNATNRSLFLNGTWIPTDTIKKVGVDGCFVYFFDEQYQYRILVNSEYQAAIIMDKLLQVQDSGIKKSEVPLKDYSVLSPFETTKKE